MPRRFPNELFDAIISSVPTAGRLSPEDRQTLRNCALVCRDWLSPSRHALFSDVNLATPAAWESFLREVVHAEGGRPWLASIHRLHFTGYDDLPKGRKDVLAKPASKWRGYSFVPILAGHLPNLEFLSLSVGLDWYRCPPPLTTFGMFSQFMSLRELQLTSSHFPSFCAFRRLLISLPALKSLICDHVEWPSEPQPSILPIPSKRPALQSLSTTFVFRSAMLALLEWLVHTPTRSTLVDWDLEYLVKAEFQLGPDHTLDYYAQIFAPCIRRLSLGNFQIDGETSKISISSFVNLTFLSLRVDGAYWFCAAETLLSVRARLNTLCIKVFYELPKFAGDSQETEDAEVATLETEGLEIFDYLLGSRDNFKDLSLLTFTLVGYRDICRKSALEAIQQKLPMLHSRGTLDTQVDLVFSDLYRPRSPLHSTVLR